LTTLAILANLLAPLAFASPATTAVAAAAAATDFVRQIPLTTNDIVYNPTTKMLYASVPSSGGSKGNSITAINPATGDIGTSVFVGSEPNRLALSDDGQTMYVSLDGASAIRRFNTATQTPGDQFYLGSDSFSQPYSLNDFAVAPGNPNLLAVARYYRGLSPPEAGVAIFDNGVQRSKTGPSHIEGSDFLAFSASASKLYGGGYNYGLRTMTIDSLGVTVDGKTSFSVGARIKFDNGLVYSSSGQVINPDTGTLLGTFSNAASYAFVPDSSVGRAYYLVSGGGTATLKAFDTTTFLPVGSMSISGIVGEPTTLVRWGANGLAFRTTGNQLYVIQTSLIPSAEPIPDPTPTPSPTPSPTPTPYDTFIKQVSIATNDLAYSQTTKMLYASVPSSGGSKGNSITAINPATGDIGTSVFVGSEPNRLALSDDGQTMYTGLDGAASVRRFDIATQTAGLQFYLGNSSFDGPNRATDISVMPGSPGTVAVSRSLKDVAIYDDGVQRAQTGNPGQNEFASPTTLYVSSGQVYKYTVGVNGLTLGKSTVTGGYAGDFVYHNGLVYLASGVVVDPEAGVVKGTFSGASGSSVAVDAPNGRVFFISNAFSSNWVLRAYDINTFLPIGSVTISGIGGFISDGPSRLLRWGTNGLAFRTGDKKVFLIQTALVNATDPVPAATPTPSPTPSPSPAYVPTFVRRLNLPANDLVYQQSSQSLYASVPSSAGAGGNSITPINPQAGTIGTPVFIGSEPNKLAVSDDGQTMYVSLDGANAIRRFDLSTLTPGLQFVPNVSFQKPQDMAVLPGNPQSLAIAAGFNGVAIYDDGVQRSKTGSGGAYAINRIEFGTSPTKLYGYDSESSGFELVNLILDADGVKSGSWASALISGYGVDIKFANGLLYSSGGRVADPEAQKLIGTFPASGTAIAVDPVLGRIFFLQGDGFNSILTLSAYDLNTFLPLGSVTLTGISGTPTNLVRWGTNGLAFSTRNFFSSPGVVSQVYLMQSALVSTAAPIPTGVQFSAGTYSLFESITGGTLTLTRTGDVSAATTVTYTTSDGTATAGLDYTATTATVTFAPGELTKTISIPLKDDNLYEGNETFNVTLSNPTSGVLLETPNVAVVTINDSESKPTVTINPTVRVTEGNAGTTNAVFTVSLSNPSVQVVTVDYTTIDGTAKAGTDYVGAAGTLTIPAGATSGTISVQVNGDLTVEPDETFLMKLNSSTNTFFISSSQSTGTIVNDDAPGTLQLSAPTFAVNEGAGSANILVTRTGGMSGAVSVNYATSNGTATAGSDYTTTSGTLSFAEGETTKSFSVPVSDDSTYEGDETLTLTLSSITGGATLGRSTAVLTILENDPQVQGVEFSQSSYTVAEGAGFLKITVTRNGDISAPASIKYATGDQTDANFRCDPTTPGQATIYASRKCDYHIAVGTLRFAAGEGTKQFTLSLVDDAYVEIPETFTLTLSNPSNTAVGQNSTATVTINDNDTYGQPNPIDNTSFFVRQLYVDLLSREPDPAGWTGWTNRIDLCGLPGQAPPPCDRVTVAGDGFLRSGEFFDRQFFVIRLYRTGLGRILRYEDVGDLAYVSGFLTTEQLELNKQDLVDEFVARPEFVNRYNGLDNTQFVDTLLQTAGVSVPADVRLGWIADLATKSRAKVFRDISERQEVSARYAHEAQVISAYYGFFTRNPDGAYLNYLQRLDSGEINLGDLANAFINAAEYRSRFGQ
jgi:sugar lactone lactonase YvrE